MSLFRRPNPRNGASSCSLADAVLAEGRIGVCKMRGIPPSPPTHPAPQGPRCSRKKAGAGPATGNKTPRPTLRDPGRCRLIPSCLDVHTSRPRPRGRAAAIAAGYRRTDLSNLWRAGIRTAATASLMARSLRAVSLADVSLADLRAPPLRTSPSARFSRPQETETGTVGSASARTGKDD